MFREPDLIRVAGSGRTAGNATNAPERVNLCYRLSKLIRSWEAVPTSGANSASPSGKGRHAELTIYVFRIPLATKNRH